MGAGQSLGDSCSPPLRVPQIQCIRRNTDLPLIPVRAVIVDASSSPDHPAGVAIRSAWDGQGWDSSTGQYDTERKRQAKVYVFAVLGEKDQLVCLPVKSPHVRHT